MHFNLLFFDHILVFVEKEFQNIESKYEENGKSGENLDQTDGFICNYYENRDQFFDELQKLSKKLA